LVVLMLIKGFDSRQMEAYLAENVVVHVFIGRQHEIKAQIRDHSNFARAYAALGKEGIDEVNRLVIQTAHGFGFVDEGSLSADPTAQELPIGYPNELMTMLRQTLAMDTINVLVDVCFRKYPNALVTNVQKGRVPSQYQSLASYVAKYVVSPPISVRRIDRYDGRRVTYHYRSHRTERTTYETVDVITFIGRMIQHTMPKGFKRIRYYGVQATKTFAKLKGIIRAALAKVEGIVKGAVKLIARLTYRERYEKSTGRDPLICPHCQGEMRWWRIWHPIYGIIYDEARVIKRGTYEATAQRSGP
jgi:hypothetical protein